MIFIFTILCGTSDRFHLFKAPERSVRIKHLCPPPPPPRHSIRMTRVKTAHCQTSDLIVFVSLTREIHEKQIDTLRVTNQQYHKIIVVK